jgi:hypothetical protein
VLFVAKQLETTTAQHIIARVALKPDRKINNLKADCPTGKSRGIIRKLASGYSIIDNSRTWLDRDPTEELYTFSPAHGFSARNGYTWQRRKSQNKKY